jgi:hypothetical protein
MTTTTKRNSNLILSNAVSPAPSVSKKVHKTYDNQAMEWK